jgi:hypothetical protein
MGFRSFLSMLWLPDGFAEAGPGFRAFASVWFGPDGLGEVGPPPPGEPSEGTYRPVYRARRR